MTEILDAHLHLWDPAARHHEWLAAHPSLQRRFGPEDLDTGRHALSGAVFVQADCRDEEALDEVRWVERLAEAHPFLSGIVAHAPLQRGRAAEHHLGKPPIAGGRMNPWRDQLARVAAHGNVACKLSGLSTEPPPGTRMSELRPYLEYGLEAFGPKRCMIGSDWPLLTLRTTIERWFDVACDVVAELSPEDRAAVMAGTATATYGLAPPELSSEGVTDARGALRR